MACSDCGNGHSWIPPRLIGKRTSLQKMRHVDFLPDGDVRSKPLQGDANSQALILLARTTEQRVQPGRGGPRAVYDERILSLQSYLFYFLSHSPARVHLRGHSQPCRSIGQAGNYENDKHKQEPRELAQFSNHSNPSFVFFDLTSVCASARRPALSIDVGPVER